MNRHPLMPPVLAAALALAACSSRDSSEPNATSPPADQAPGGPAKPTNKATAAMPDDSRGSGTLRLGDTTYAFNVRSCDLSGEADDDFQTLVGRGQDSASEGFDVFVSRDESQGNIVHTVSFQQGDVLRGKGRVFEAMNMRYGGSWQDHAGAPGPLVQIDGQKVSAQGKFADQDGDRGFVEGVLPQPALARSERVAVAPGRSAGAAAVCIRTYRAPRVAYRCSSRTTGNACPKPNNQPAAGDLSPSNSERTSHLET